MLFLIMEINWLNTHELHLIQTKEDIGNSNNSLCPTNQITSNFQNNNNLNYFNFENNIENNNNISNQSENEN